MRNHHNFIPADGIDEFQIDNNGDDLDPSTFRIHAVSDGDGAQARAQMSKHMLRAQDNGLEAALAAQRAAQ